MSLRIHCDHCDAFIYETASGINSTAVTPSAMPQLGNWFFCSDQCQQNWVRIYVLHEHIEDEPRLVEVQ